ncbi:Gfo/Idh/MocA family oxidoreductase [candidate division KSB1 bacterium]|nr:Gfo/Idh/MocA family oxidoreductase [candidate division KSB1 bacterium]
MKILRTAVVGAGRIGWKFHIPQVVSHEGFKLVAVVEPVQERLDEVNAEFGVTGYHDFQHLLESETLDLVVIASPTHLHQQQITAAFQHGCDVFCDKPLAPTLEHVDQLIDAMQQHRRKLMLYQPHRGRREAVSLQAMLKKQLIGPVYMIKRERYAYLRRNDWQALKKFGGGMLNNYGAHYIDQLLYLAQSPAKRIHCVLRRIVSFGDAEDVVKVVIETESGLVLDLDINMASAFPMTPWRILGQRGSILLDEAEQVWRVKYYYQRDLPDIAVHPELAAPNRMYSSGEVIPWREKSIPLSDYEEVDYYQKCYDYFALNREPFVPIQETREVMRVIEECRKNNAG